jgi:hypothetical protein
MEVPPEMAAPVRAAPPRRYRRGAREQNFEYEAEDDGGPADSVPWGQAWHSFHRLRLLTAEDPRRATPPGFRGELYAPQQTLLHAMLELERRPALRVADPGTPRGWEPTAQTRCARLAERFSFGKTVLALALVLAQPVPPGAEERLEELVTLPFLPAAENGHGNLAPARLAGHSGFDPRGAGFLPELTLRYACFLPLTVVAAAASVITQWEENARRFTTLRFFTVEHVRGLRQLEALYRRGRLGSKAGGKAGHASNTSGDYDLLFVKAGRVTANYIVAGERAPAPAPGQKSRSLFDALAALFEGVPVARLIIDDYDTLKLSGDDGFLPALFTWLISATRRQTTAAYSLHSVDSAVAAPPELGTFLRANLPRHFPVLGAALDDPLNNLFSLRCARAYVDAHLSATAVHFRRVFVAGGRAAAVLRDLEVPEEVLEMVNADAIETAARALGLAASSVTDVIRRVVGDHLKHLQHALRTLARLGLARALHARGVLRLSARVLQHGSDADVRDLDAGEAGEPPEVGKSPEAGSPAALGVVPGASTPHDVPASRAELDALERWACERRDKHGQALARMRDNIREKCCQCCTVPFGASEAAYILTGCCQILICELCVMRPAPRAAGRAVPDTSTRQCFITRCPNCARPLDLHSGFVRVGADLDLAAALEDGAVLAAARSDAADADVNTAAAQADALPPLELDAALPDNPKLRALVQLLTDQPVACLRDVPVVPYIQGLLAGRRDAPWPADKRKKFLVFTVHPESTRHIAAALTAAAVPFRALQGNRTQKDAAVRALHAEVDVLLVTAPKDCGGLDLPLLSHVVFYHRVLDRNVEAQAAARGQRLQREHNLEVVALLNEAEAVGL